MVLWLDGGYDPLIQNNMAVVGLCMYTVIFFGTHFKLFEIVYMSNTFLVEMN